MAQDGMFGAIASGAASGAGTGAAVGSALPGYGTAIGAAVGAVAGGIGAGVKQKKANEAQGIPVVDPAERARMAALEQTSKSLSSGSDVATKQGILQQKNIGRAAQNAISRSTGGDVGSTIDALLKSQKATQSGVNQAVAQSANRLPYFDNAASQLRTRMSQRRLELDLLNRSQKVAENAQARTDANVNAQALLATQGGTQTIPEGFGQVSKEFQGFGANKQPVISGGGYQQKGVAATPAVGGFDFSAPTIPTGPMVTDPSLGDIQGVQGLNLTF